MNPQQQQGGAYPPQQQYQGYPPQQQQQPPSAQTPMASPAPTDASPGRQVSKSRLATSMDQKVLLTRTPDEESSDGRIRNKEAVQKIRDTWIYKQVRARQDEFTQYRNAQLFVGTWNVNAKGKEEPLEDWICADWASRGQPDIVAVGFQEIVDLNAVNVAVDNKTQQRSAFWCDRLSTTLNKGGNQYIMLTQKSMVGLLIVVFVKNVHHQRVKHIYSASVGVGVLGMGGNKGGVSIRMQFYDSTLCFVCSHLAAHRENITGRNADFANVLNKTAFEVGEDAVRQVIRNGSLAQWTLGSSVVGVRDHDIIIWLGDLNYRIDESLATEKVLQLSEKLQLGELVSLDQLNIERAAGRVFQEFDEAPIQFAPTYKYQPGTDVYEQRPDKKLRAPAWCDRILWRTADDASQVQLFSYNRSERPNVSDHKAVYASMQITIKDVIEAKREAIYGELMKVLDRYENQTLPVVGLDKATLNFGPIRYEQSVSLPIHLTNTGSVVAQYRFVPKPDEVVVCKPWLTVSPLYGMLIPAEQPLTINCTITIDQETAQSLNSGREVLEDILILRLENGRDYYLTVQGEYARSCFGMSLDELVLYSDPIRSIPLDPIERAKKMENMPNKGANALCVPKELWRVIDAIYEKGLVAPHLFVEPGRPEEVKQIRECLDTGSPFGQYQIHSYAEVLTTFLTSLSSPVIPPHLCPTMEIDSQNIQMCARRLLEVLPPIHYNVFVYVISFLREVLAASDRNQLTSTKVARIACSCLLTSSSATFSENENNDKNNAANLKRTGMQLIILHLLETSSI